jgi:hypothetical protein
LSRVSRSFPGERISTRSVGSAIAIWPDLGALHVTPRSGMRKLLSARTFGMIPGVITTLHGDAASRRCRRNTSPIAAWISPCVMLAGAIARISPSTSS